MNKKKKKEGRRRRVVHGEKKSGEFDYFPPTSCVFLFFIFFSRLNSSFIQNVILNKDVKSGHRQHHRIIGPSTRAYTIKCQLYLIRQEYENPTDWQLGYDFVKGYNEPHAHIWFEGRKPQ